MHSPYLEINSGPSPSHPGRLRTHFVQFPSHKSPWAQLRHLRAAGGCCWHSPVGCRQMAHKENDEGAHPRSPIKSLASILPPRDPQTPGPGHRGPKPCPWFRGRAERVGCLGCSETWPPRARGPHSTTLEDAHRIASWPTLSCQPCFVNSNEQPEMSE